MRTSARIVLGAVVVVLLLPVLRVEADDAEMTPARVADWVLWGDEERKTAASAVLEAADDLFLRTFRDALAARRADPMAAADRLIEQALAGDPGRDEAEALLHGMGPVAVRRLVDRLAGTDTHPVEFGAPPLEIFDLPEPPVAGERATLHVSVQVWTLPPRVAADLLPSPVSPDDGIRFTYVDDNEATALLLSLRARKEAHVVHAPSLVVESGVPASLEIHDPVSYVKEYRVERRGGVLVPEPVLATLDAGLSIDLEATTSAEARTVTFETAYDFRVVPRPIRTKEIRIEGVSEPLEIQVPVLLETRARASFQMPTGGTAVLRGLPAPEGPEREVVIFVTVHRLAPAERSVAGGGAAAHDAPFVDVEAWALEADREAFRRALGPAAAPGDGVGVLRADQARALLGEDGAGGEGVTVLMAPRLTTSDGRRADARVLAQLSYVSDYDVTREGGRTVASPIVQTITEGLILEVTPSVSADWTRIDLSARATWAEVTRPIPTFTTKIEGLDREVTIQLPEMQVRRATRRVDVVPGGTVFLGPLGDGDGDPKVRLVLLRATITPR